MHCIRRGIDRGAWMVKAVQCEGGVYLMQRGPGLTLFFTGQRLGEGGDARVRMLVK